MRNLIKAVSIGLMALAIGGIQHDLQAQENKGSTVKVQAPQGARSLPFHGKLKALDREAGTVTVGNRTFKLVPETKYLQGGLDEAKVGEPVGGSYVKAEDGTMIVNSIRFGPKPKKGQKKKLAEE